MDDRRKQREQLRRERQRRRINERKMYSDASGDPKLRESFALYIDELGTRQLSEKMSDIDLRRNIADQDLLRTFLDSSDSDLEPYDESGEKVLTFSDNTVIASPVTDRPDLWGDRGLFSHLASLAMYLLNQGVRRRFYRGGISVGLLYANEGYVSGPALIEAVEIEEDIAIVPRVVLSDQCALLVSQHIADHSGGDPRGDPYNSYVVRDRDSKFFVNYLFALIEDEIYDGAGSVESGLADHRQAVLQRTEAAIDGGAGMRTLQKYNWLIDYHNWAAAALFDYPEQQISAADAFSPITFLVPET